MFNLLVAKELKAIILSPKFVATFAVCTVLILLSIVAGIQDYKASQRLYEASAGLADQEMEEATSWFMLSNTVYRVPSAMQVFVSGVNNDVGRFSRINAHQSVKLRQSHYTINPIFAVFRYLDFAFIVQIVLSLFAILFSYDAISGEKESGTLKLALSNAVSRVQYVIAKFVGSWLGLVVPLLIPITLGLLLVVLFRVPMTGVEWAKVGLLIGASVLYFTFFLALGLLVSAFTKRSSASFLTLLVLWIFTVLIIPRGGMMMAAQLQPVPTIAEVESQRDAYAADRMDQFHQDIMAVFEEQREAMQGMTPDERERYQDDNSWTQMEEQERLRKDMDTDIQTFEQKLNEDLRARQQQQERLAFMLSRFSPAASYKLVAMNLASTDIDLKKRYEDALVNYRNVFNQFADDKQESTGGMTAFHIGGGSNAEPLDLSEVPRFEQPRQTTAAVFDISAFDLGLLSLFSVLAFVGAMIGFVRYDVR